MFVNISHCATLCIIIPLSLTEQFLNLYPEHLPFVLNHHPESCTEKTSCTFKNGSCWGYEPDCKASLRYGKPQAGCKSDDLRQEFQKRVDFDYVRERQDEIMELCKSDWATDSYLHCSRYTRFCIGRNIYMNFKALLHSNGRDKFQEDLFNDGDIGGFCRLDKTLLQKQHEHKSPLQSWYAELQNFTKLPFNPLLETNHCDIIINHPVAFMKLDYGGNMFHHFCDFFNLYVSQHVNNSWFGQNLHVIMWDTATSHYFDLFSISWKVFTQHPVTTLMDLKGKRVCFREAMFPLLPRMRAGMFYNTYVPDTCVGSNLFRAFSEHFLYRMNITQDGPLHAGNKPVVRLTLLQRGNPSKENVFRQIKNQSQLIKSLKSFHNVKVKVVEYDWKKISFEDQLSITHNTDIFIGMHGAGLAHFLFLPEWAVAFELYNCGDARCYSDLARLRGLHYLTWPQDAPAPNAYDQGKHKVYGDNPKFWNWEFDVGTFKSLVAKARNAVLDNPTYQLSLRAKANGVRREEL